MKIEPSELRTVILGGRGVAAQLEAAGRPVAGAMVNVLCDIACEREDAEIQPEPIVVSRELLSPDDGEKEKSHRHVWGGPNGDVCTTVPGCVARPRKKKEAPAAAEGGS